jgi:hypothetical protein
MIVMVKCCYAVSYFQRLQHPQYLGSSRVHYYDIDCYCWTKNTLSLLSRVQVQDDTTTSTLAEPA